MRISPKVGINKVAAGLAAAALISACGGGGSDSNSLLIQPTAAAQTVACSEYLLASLPADVVSRVQCFKVEVAQDPTRPNADLAKVSVAFTVLTPRVPVSRADPLLILTGGVGQAINRQGFGRALTSDRFEQLAPGRQIVLMDHRGVGASRPLAQCANVSFANPTPDLPTDAALATCKASLAAAKVDLQFFTAVQAGQDVIAVRQALGITSWNVYGFSYGVTVALEMLRRDDPASVRAIALDGVAGPDTSGYSQEYRLGNLIDTISACEADAACRARYPDSLGTLATLLAGLPDDPGFFPAAQAGTTLTRQRLVAALHAAVEFPDENGEDLRGRIPAAIYALDAGDRTPVDALATAFDINYPLADPPPAAGAALTFPAYVCAHDVPRQTEGIGLTKHPRPVAQILDSSAWTDYQGWARVCAALGIPKGPDVDTTLPRSDRPALVMSGERDGATPRTGGDRLAQALSRSFNILFPDTGHVQTLQQFDCASNVLAQFFGRPEAAPDASCKEAARSTVWTLLP